MWVGSAFPSSLPGESNMHFKYRRGRKTSISVKSRLTWFASLFQELDLEQKIELEIKMREGSAKLLAASKQQAQSLEAARALLTSNERMSAYMAELQRRKRDPQIR